MANTNLRIGHGYDVHRLVDGRKLILGGVHIPWEKGLLGHSDADVLTHAIMDALLGAARPGGHRQGVPRHRPGLGGHLQPHPAGTDGRAAPASRIRAGERGRHVGCPEAQGGVVHSRNAGKAGGRAGSARRAGEREGHHRGRAWVHRYRPGDGGPRGGTAGKKICDKIGEWSVTVHLFFRPCIEWEERSD